MNRICFFLMILTCLPFSQACGADNFKKSKNHINVGIATIDITPKHPIRLAGFALRSKAESDTVGLPLKAKALAIGNSVKDLSLIITIDLIGTSYQITESVKQRLTGLVQQDRITISASHTHSGPEIGNLINILHYTSGNTPFDDRLLSDEQITRINQYREFLINKLEMVAREAINNREPSLIYWGKGNVDFARNRRRLEFVDYEMPLMKITNTDGELKGVFLSYACHAVSLGSKNNKIHGEWVGSAQRMIEERHPASVAMIAIGCAGDINPKPDKIAAQNDDLFYLPEKYGRQIADEVDRVLLEENLHNVSNIPSIKYTDIELPYGHKPTVQEFIENLNDITVKGYYAKLALDRIARGETIPESVRYPVQLWSFGNDLKIIVLGGEVVSEYAYRLKKEIDSDKLWILSYSNDVSCYIPSKRYIEKMSQHYEVDASMYYYNHPAKFSSVIEDQIVNSIKLMLKQIKHEKRF